MTADPNSLVGKIARAMHADDMAAGRAADKYEAMSAESIVWYESNAAAVLPLVRAAQADALRHAASDPALRLSGHSGISITRLRDSAAQYETKDPGRGALDGLIGYAQERVNSAITGRALDDWNMVGVAAQDYRDTHYPEPFTWTEAEDARRLQSIADGAADHYPEQEDQP